MRRSRVVLAAAVGILVAGAGASVALASIPDSNGMIHACYQSPPPAHGANLQVIDTGNGGSCSGGMVALNWNQTGPQGPAGPTGPQGPAGPSTGGSSGLDLEIIYATNTFSGGVWTPNPVTASCPTDHPYVFGGGGFGQNVGALPGYPDNGPSATESETGTANGWTVPGGNNQLTAWAICGK